MVVTLEELEDLDACPEGLDEFRRTFGVEAEVTRANLLRMSAHVDWLVDNHPGLDAHRASYFEGIRPHVASFHAALSPLVQARNAAISMHKAEYNAALHAAINAAIKGHGPMGSCDEWDDFKAPYMEVLKRAVKPFDDEYQERARPHLDRMNEAKAGVLADLMGLA